MTTNAYRRALYGTIIHVSANVVTLLSICLAMYMSFHYPNDCLVLRNNRFSLVPGKAS